MSTMRLIDLYLILNCLLLYEAYSENICKLSLLGLDGIDKSIKFYKNNYLNIDLDGSSGFQLLENFLRSIPQTSVVEKCPKENSEIIKRMSREISLLSRINFLAKKVIARKTPRYYRNLSPVIESFMKEKYNWKKLNLNEMKSSKTRQPSLSYDEELGDSCMSDLVNKNCTVSDKCYEGFVTSPPGTGYVATHKAIYLSIYLSNKCYLKYKDKFSRENVEVQMKNICKTILKDNNALLNLSNQMIINDLDVFLERIVICGGHLRFVNFFPTRAFDLVRKHQNPKTGCFGDITWNEENRSEMRRSKRRSNDMGEDCESHTLGLGAATFGAFMQKFFLYN